MPFAAPPLRHPQPFLPPKPLNPLVIDDPTLCAGIVVGGPESPPGMVLGVLTQPDSQRCIGILGRGRYGLVALAGSVLPGHPAGEPFADPQHQLEVANGCPPAFRA